MVAAQNMLNVKNSLIEDTRALARAPDMAELSKRSAAARAELASLRAIATDRLQSLSSDDAASTLVSLIDRFAFSLSAVEKGSGDRIEQHAKRVERLENMEAALRVAKTTAEPLGRQLREMLASRLSSLAAAGDLKKIQDINKNEVSWLISLQRQRTFLDAISNAMAAAAAATNEADLRGLETALAMGAQRLTSEEPLPDTPFTVIFDSGKSSLLESIANPDTSIINAGLQELQAEQEVETAVTASAQATDDLAKALSQFADRRSTVSGEAIQGASEEIRLAMLVQFVLAVLALATAGLIGWLYVRNNLVHRMLGLRDAMRAIAGGNLDYPIAVTGGDELGAMAEALGVFRDNANQMTQMQTQREEERRQAEQDRRQALLSMAQTLESGAGALLSGVAEAASKLRSTAHDMSGDAQAASTETDRVARASEQASCKVDIAAGAAQEMSASIQEASRHLAGSTQASAHARNEAGTAQHTVVQLQEAAARIGDIINLIHSIAQKTHLLALNATIEAARAGEAGKGFVVVAGEVNGLATQTAGATQEIERQVAAMQAATNATVMDR